MSRVSVRIRAQVHLLQIKVREQSAALFYSFSGSIVAIYLGYLMRINLHWPNLDGLIRKIEFFGTPVLASIAAAVISINIGPKKAVFYLVVGALTGYLIHQYFYKLMYWIVVNLNEA